jgi:hypothetical protein
MAAKVAHGDGLERLCSSRKPSCRHGIDSFDIIKTAVGMAEAEVFQL